MKQIKTRFGLTKDPFSKDVPVEEFFEHDRAKAATRRLEAALEARVSAVLTGEPGTGKTFILRALEESLPPGRFRFTYLYNSHVNVRDFYRQLSSALGIEPRATAEALFRAVSRHVEETALAKIQPVLLLDEAQLLAMKVLEHLPILLNFQRDSKPFLSIVLIGLPELRRLLSRNVLSSLAARLPVRVHLEGLGPAEVAEYLAHRLRSAGSTKDVFSEDAVLLIAEASGGALRKIDVLARHALEVASEGKSAIVDAATIERALERAAEALL